MAKQYTISHENLGTLISAFYNRNCYLMRPINKDTHTIGINMLLDEYGNEQDRLDEENEYQKEMQLYEKLKQKYGS